MNATIISLLNTEVISERVLDVARSYYSTAVAAAFIWYCLLTFDKEVTFFWKWRPSGACVLFLVNRYLTVLNVIYYSSLLRVGDIYTKAGCAANVFLMLCFPFLRYIIWAVFSCLRVYALHRRPWLAAVVFVLSLGIVVIGMAQLRFVHTSIDPETQQCWIFYDAPIGWQEYMLNGLSYGSFIVAETTVAVLTWVTMRHYNHQRRHLNIFGRKLVLSSVFYENGITCFVFTALLYTMDLCVGMVLTVIPSYFTSFNLPLRYVYSIVTATEPLVGFLVDRFLIQLQEAASARVYLSEDALSSTGSPHLATAESISLVQFVRADVDSWVQSEYDPPLVGESSQEAETALDESEIQLVPENVPQRPSGIS